MRALILMAHADDESLGAGGTIPKLVESGWDVRVVILADGVVRARGSEQDNRPAARAACRVLGVDEPVFMGFPDQRFDTVAMADLAGAVGALGLEPDLIITHSPADLNLDHRICADVAKIVGRPKKKPVSILAAEIPNTAFWNGAPFGANYYVDIRHTLERKIQAFAEYSGELQPFPHPWSEEALRLLAQYHGVQSGLELAEAFMVIRGYEGRLPQDR